MARRTLDRVEDAALAVLVLLSVGLCLSLWRAFPDLYLIRQPERLFRVPNGQGLATGPPVIALEGEGGARLFWPGLPGYAPLWGTLARALPREADLGPSRPERAHATLAFPLPPNLAVRYAPGVAEVPVDGRDEGRLETAGGDLRLSLTAPVPAPSGGFPGVAVTASPAAVVPAGPLRLPLYRAVPLSSSDVAAAAFPDPLAVRELTAGEGGDGFTDGTALVSVRPGGAFQYARPANGAMPSVDEAVALAGGFLVTHPFLPGGALLVHLAFDPSGWHLLTLPTAGGLPVLGAPLHLTVADGVVTGVAGEAVAYQRLGRWETVPPGPVALARLPAGTAAHLAWAYPAYLPQGSLLHPCLVLRLSDGRAFAVTERTVLRIPPAEVAP